MARSLVLLALAVATCAQAESLVPAIVDAQGLSEPQARKVQHAADGALRQSSSLPVGEGPAPRKGAPRRCDDGCAQALAKELDASLLLLLELKALDPKAERLSVDASLYIRGEKLGFKHAEGALEGVDGWLKPALEALLPGYARRGFGALRVEAEAGSVLKVDGRVAEQKRGEPLSVTAGVHQVDVVFPDGNAVLQRVEVAEGQRMRLEVTPLDVGLTRDATPGTGALRVTSYAVWMVGAAAIAGGLVAGALAKNTAAGLSPCRADTRDCPTLDVVLEKNRQAASLTSTGNLLLGVGGGLAAVGAGLFVLDVATP